MSLNNWIVSLTIIVGIVPIIKMAKDKRFSFYNLFFIIIGGIALILIKCQDNQERRMQTDNKRDKAKSDSAYHSDMKNVANKLTATQNTVAVIKSSLDHIGLRANDTGGIFITNDEILKKFILSSKSQVNVTSINQKGGQTANTITNNK